MSSQTSLNLEPAGSVQERESDDDDLASLSLIARLRLVDVNERLAGLGNHKDVEGAKMDEALAAIRELQDATLLIQSISTASITRLEAAREDQRPRGQDAQAAAGARRPAAAADLEPLLLLVETIFRSPASPSVLIIGTSVPCAVCKAEIDGEVIRPACGHTWDVLCLTELFRRATKDESLFPPTCCGRPLPLALIRNHIGDELVSLFLEKELEHETRRRVYCAVPSCSIFLGPAADKPSRLFCHRCGTKTTCAHCSGQAHSKSIRCTSSDDAELAVLAEQEGWRRCRRCGHMVELTSGCNHMTCRCRFEFCYMCGSRWKTCDCPQWHEERLRAAAEDGAQWRPLGDGNVRVVHDLVDQEAREEVREEQDEDDVGLGDIDGEELENETAHHPPTILDPNPLQLERTIPSPEPRAAEVGTWQGLTTKSKHGQNGCDYKQVARTAVIGFTFVRKISTPMVRWCTRVGAVDVQTLKSGSARIA
ncbi:hypothetical protein GSI_06860 [Ganoderma sinense ZZ0214-1]|uniref:RING-type domain-containing protein n=1 Tax=Ganoderma sinense ZZ0214-1 TaxID=1077348 RepID=A0A2G8SEF7_9APHY|nr:hypothetical protein GSI_06860 [Ganoderma sinense ZZ0214-1]